jgi:hypothetical protein
MSAVNSTKKTLGQIAVEGALRAMERSEGNGMWDEAAADVRDAVIGECARQLCNECRSGWAAHYDAANKNFYHCAHGPEEVEIDCKASALHAMRRISPGKEIISPRYRALCESDTDLAANICKRVAELPDRSSPDDWPEAMLVTHEELTFIVVDEILTEIDRLVNAKEQSNA